jgi:hypothetical protein
MHVGSPSKTHSGTAERGVAVYLLQISSQHIQRSAIKGATMIHSTIILLAVGWLIGSSEAQGPVAAMFEEVSYDFGTVPRGSKRVHAFAVNNASREPLRILSIRIPCNCVTAHATKSELAPGESTTVIVYLDTRRFSGAMTKYAYVLFDRPREEAQLVVRAFSHDGLFCEPDSLAFGKAKKGASLEKSMSISITDPRLGGALKATSQSTFVQATVKTLEKSAGSASIQLTAKVDPNLPVGDWYTTIELRSEDARLAPIQIPVTVTIDP